MRLAPDKPARRPAARQALRVPLLILVLLAGQPASAQGFPGRGDPADWSDALPHYNLANRYLGKGRSEEAAAKYRDAIAIYKFDPDFYINLGVALRKMGEYGEAEKAFRQAAALNPADWVAASNLANALLKQNRLPETVRAFEQALKCNPPPSEKEAMLKDIADIKKIISMQAPPPVQAGAHPAGRSPDKPAPGRAATNKAPPPVPAKIDRQAMEKSGWDYVYGTGQ